MSNLSKKVYIETYGCTMNQSDSEYVSQVFLDYDFSVSSFEDSNFVLINTCGVKKTTEDKILSRLKFLSSLDKKIIIAGCLPKIDLERAAFNSNWVSTLSFFPVMMISIGLTLEYISAINI